MICQERRRRYSLLPSDSVQYLTSYPQPGTERPEAAYTFERQDLLQGTVDMFSQWLQSHVVLYLQDKVFNTVIAGLEKVDPIVNILHNQ